MRADEITGREVLAEAAEEIERAEFDAWAADQNLTGTEVYAAVDAWLARARQERAYGVNAHCKQVLPPSDAPGADHE